MKKNNGSIDGSKIMKKRKELNLTTQDLSQLTGIRKSQIERIENGTTKNPYMRTILPITRTLHISVEDIYQLD
ncbi:MAG: helix-turn-helix transcriptional regulator [Clostridiales bacterium]|nr:helix-turn-helix transcriptional regulator [Clostridiales bacterium]